MKPRKHSSPVGLTLITLAALALAVGASAPRARAANGAGSPRKLVAGVDYVPGEMIVRFRAASNPADRAAALARHGAARMRTISSHGNSELSHVKLPEGKAVEEAVADLGTHPDVELAQPNYIYRTATVPNDPQYGQLWALRNAGQQVTYASGPDAPVATANPGTAGKDMGLETAWNVTTDCSGAIVAVVDSGVNYGHADLAANMWNGGSSYPNHGYDFVTNTNDPMDKNGHGTHVAGTIGAVGNNGIGTTGICWNARIMAVRVMDASGSGTTATITQGINFAVANGAKVINMSVSGTAADSAFNTALTNAQNQGVVLVVAAGNDGQNNDSGNTPAYPCNYGQSTLVCVAAVDQSFGLAAFSNYGSTSVDVAAPGVNILSTWAGAVNTINDSLTTGWSGTTATSTGWGYKTLNFGANTACLVTPPTYNYSTAKYANNTDDRFWKSFNTSGAASASLTYYLMYDTEPSLDFVRAYVGTAAADPVPAGQVLESVSGSTSGTRIRRTFDVSSYIGANTTIGFQLTSNATNANYGANVSAFSLRTLTINNTSYNVDEGTSMATPHVAGLAAMIMSYNPSYTAAEVVASIKNGGVAAAALSGKTATGKVVNAMGSLSYIAAPSGVSLQKL